MKAKKNTGIKIVSNNRKARFNYFFLETIEAGVVLKGSEVKSLRDGKANITDAYAIDNHGEIFLVNSHSLQGQATTIIIQNLRKLLLKKRD